MLIKTTPLKAISVKQGPQEVGENVGEFEAIVATYDVDSVGDKITPGAFSKSLDSWKSSGKPIPVIWSHQHSDPFSHIGETIDAAERPGEGLWIKGQLDLENPTARQVWKLLKSGRVDQFSFAYDVEQSEPDTANKGVQLLHEIKLYEVGPTLIGANQQTRTLVAKSDAHTLVGLSPDQLSEREPADPEASPASEPTPDDAKSATSAQGASESTKAGRVLSARNEADLRQAVELVEGVLAQIGAPMPDEEQQSAKSRPVNDEDRSSGKSEEPPEIASLGALLALIAVTEGETS